MIRFLLLCRSLPLLMRRRYTRWPLMLLFAAYLCCLPVLAETAYTLCLLKTKNATPDKAQRSVCAFTQLSGVVYIDFPDGDSITLRPDPEKANRYLPVGSGFTPWRKNITVGQIYHLEAQILHVLWDITPPAPSIFGLNDREVFFHLRDGKEAFGLRLWRPDSADNQFRASDAKRTVLFTASTGLIEVIPNTDWKNAYRIQGKPLLNIAPPERPCVIARFTGGSCQPPG